MPDRASAPSKRAGTARPNGAPLRHAHSQEDLAACFLVISQLRPRLKGAEEWLERASQMAADGYRVLAAWEDDRVLAVAGYRVMENLIHDRISTSVLLISTMSPAASTTGT